MKVYGIKNCNTVAKALKWLSDNGVSYEFHDYKKLGISEEKLEEWSEKTGWEALLNKRGTTWKKLSPELQNEVTNKAAAINLMTEKTSVIKRPIIENENVLVLGYDEEAYQQLI